MLQLFAKTQLKRHVAITAARNAMDRAGAAVVNIRPYAGHSTVLEWTVPVDDWPTFVQQLATGAMGLDWIELPSPDAPPPKADDGEVHGTLQLTLLGDSGDYREEIPAVPG